MCVCVCVISSFFDLLIAVFGYRLNSSHTHQGPSVCVFVSVCVLRMTDRSRQDTACCCHIKLCNFASGRSVDVQVKMNR